MLYVEGRTHVRVKFCDRSPEPGEDRIVEIRPERDAPVGKKKCPTCSGAGRWDWDIECHVCNGSGFVSADYERPDPADPRLWSAAHRLGRLEWLNGRGGGN